MAGGERETGRLNREVPCLSTCPNLEPPSPVVTLSYGRASAEALGSTTSRVRHRVFRNYHFSLSVRQFIQFRLKI